MVRVKDQELRTLCIQIYNDAVAEVQAQSNGRLFPMAMLPVWDREATLRELRRAKEDLHLRGVLMSDYPDGLGLPDYGNSYWDPFWELCNDLDLPMNFHIGGRGSKIDAEWGKTLPWASFGPQRSGVVQNTAFMMSNATTIANFVLSGLFDRYPNLKLVSVESGVGWIPYLMEGLEYQLDEFAGDECKDLQRRPASTSATTSSRASGSRTTVRVPFSRQSASTTCSSKPTFRIQPACTRGPPSTSRTCSRG